MRERRRVVLPEPRKPVRIVMGIGGFDIVWLGGGDRRWL
jgi:hypothetical protein